MIGYRSATSLRDDLHHIIFHRGQNKFRPNTGDCLERGGIYVLGSYSALMKRRRKIQAASSIPPTAKLTANAVVNVVVVAASAVVALALSCQRPIGKQTSSL